MDFIGKDTKKRMSYIYTNQAIELLRPAESARFGIHPYVASSYTHAVTRRSELLVIILIDSNLHE